MRPLLALLLGTLWLAACTKPVPPPVGRWEGTYESGGTFIVARLELTSDGQARISAPDVTDANIASYDDRMAMRENLADRLAGGWGEVKFRPMAFDGATFRLRGGFAPQFEWNRSSNSMTLFIYFGANPALHFTMRPVSEFSDNPWQH